MIQREIPSSGEFIPALGLGTWQSFDVSDKENYPNLSRVLEELHTCGGKLIDSSPMYGRSETVIGDLTFAMAVKDDFFYATKVWTQGYKEGIAQMESSFKKMQRQSMDLMQIHNLTDWKTHLPVLRDWKASGKIRYIGITHYVDDMHGELERLISKEKLDFVQFNYAIDARHAEKRLLPAAKDLGVATLINRPLGEGRLFNRVKNKALPEWAAELDIQSWSAFFLKFILSHPAVTCVIPATASPEHALDNFKAGSGPLPDETFRTKMVKYLNSISS